MTALWVHETAERFWSEAGGAPTELPRDLLPAVTWALPVAVIGLPDLRISTVDRWLAAHDVEARISIPDRALRACVMMHDGSGLLFLDEGDPDDERRFSLAHEVAHCLVEWARPRERARERLGADVLSVLDGRRNPSPEERIGALLAGVQLGVRLHLMERTPDGHAPGRDVSAAERLADDLAFELLAPSDLVRAHLPRGTSSADAEVILQRTFGLPSQPAHSYARHLIPAPREGSLFRQLFSAS